jgi:RHS repeat-associated protein
VAQVELTATKFGKITGRKVVYLHDDHLGSIESVTGAATVTQRFKFDPFGQRIDPQTLAPALGAPDVTSGFTDQEHDDELGLVNMRGRIYDAKIGRFLSADPLVSHPESSQGFSRYSYVSNNPLNRIDPSGFSDDGKLGKAGNPCDGKTPNSGGAVNCDAGAPGTPGSTYGAPPPTTGTGTNDGGVSSVSTTDSNGRVSQSVTEPTAGATEMPGAGTGPVDYYIMGQSGSTSDVVPSRAASIPGSFDYSNTDPMGTPLAPGGLQRLGTFANNTVAGLNKALAFTIGSLGGLVGLGLVAMVPHPHVAGSDTPDGKAGQLLGGLIGAFLPSLGPGPAVGEGVAVVAARFGTKNAGIFARAAEILAGRTPSSLGPFMDHLAALGQAVKEAVPMGQVWVLDGTVEGNTIYGAIRNGLGIVETKGGTMIVHAPQGGPVTILGPLLP